MTLWMVERPGLSSFQMDSPSALPSVLPLTCLFCDSRLYPPCPSVYFPPLLFCIIFYIPYSHAFVHHTNFFFAIIVISETLRRIQISVTGLYGNFRFRLFFVDFRSVCDNLKSQFRTPLECGLQNASLHHIYIVHWPFLLSHSTYLIRMCMLIERSEGSIAKLTLDRTCKTMKWIDKALIWMIWESIRWVDRVWSSRVIYVIE